MVILAGIRERWTTKDRLINAVKRDGVTNHILTVEVMQQTTYSKELKNV